MRSTRRRNFRGSSLACGLGLIVASNFGCEGSVSHELGLAHASTALAAEDGVLGRWAMDDCVRWSTALVDGSGAGADAQRTDHVTCGEGFDGHSVVFDSPDDRVEAVGSGFGATAQLTLAARVRPLSSRGGTLVAKSDGRRTPFALSLSRDGVVFNLQLSGRRVNVRTSEPIPLAQWTHIVGSYDGQFARVFVNGRQVGEVSATGTLSPDAGSIRMGEGYQGELDDVLVAAKVLTPAEAGADTCVLRPALLSVTPTRQGPVAPGTTATYALRLTNDSHGPCPRAEFTREVEVVDAPVGVTAEVTPATVQLEVGQSADLTLTVVGNAEAASGAHAIRVWLSTGDDSQSASGREVSYVLEGPAGECVVRTEHELVIRDLTVVEDPVRTVYNPDSTDPRAGAWTFGRLVEQLAPNRNDAPRMVQNLFRTWLRDQTINGFTAAARPQIQQLMLDGWPQRRGGLDLARAPLHLLAIINRVDLRDLAKGQAGEGRFVFGVLDRAGKAADFNLIVEYRLPAKTEAEVLEWAKQWHALGSLRLPSEEFNSALQAITDRFTARNAEPGRTNNSSFAQLRTREAALHPDGTARELREFALAPDGRSFRQVLLKQTPDESFQNKPALAAFVNENESAILLEQHTVPERFQGVPFLALASVVSLHHWQSPDITNSEARHKFALNTCNGCHSPAETGTFFTMISPRERGEESHAVGFLSGSFTRNPVVGRRVFNDLERRTADLSGLVCEATPTVSLSKGIGRVH